MNHRTELENIAAEQSAEELATRPSKARAHYEAEAALAEPINALEAVMRICHPLSLGLPKNWTLMDELAALAHAREVLKKWGKV